MTRIFTPRELREEYARGTQFSPQAQGRYLKATESNSLKLAIAAFCTECMGGNILEAHACESRCCALWPFRPGTKGKPNAKTNPRVDPGA